MNLIIIPTVEIAEHTRFVCVNAKGTYPVEIPPLDFFGELVYAALDDIITERLAYMSNSYFVSGLLSRCGDWPYERSSYNITYEELIDNVLTGRLFDIVGHHIPSGSFDEWTLHRSGSCSDIRIQRGGDFRIDDWLRLKQQYEPATL